MSDSNDILAALADVKDPETGKSLTASNQITDVKVEGDSASCTLALTSFSAPLKNRIRASVIEMIQNQCSDIKNVEVSHSEIERPATPLGQPGLKIKSIIAVGSGKGGVGKSTMTACLAYALKNAGCKVGILDADVYGPSVPTLFGINEKPEVIANEVQPIEKDGLKVMSIGFLVPAEEAIVWRGPMLHRYLQQFLAGTNWGELDYLLIDMPPGTGDVALSLSQLIPLTGSVVVCTPQKVALIDAIKAISMFRTVKIPVLGMVENMSHFVCPDNGKRYDIFGSGGAKEKAAEMSIPFLGEVPINIQMRIQGDEGTIGEALNDEESNPYLTTLAENLVKNLADRIESVPAMPSLNLS